MQEPIPLTDPKWLAITIDYSDGISIHLLKLKETLTYSLIKRIQTKTIYHITESRLIEWRDYILLYPVVVD